MIDYTKKEEFNYDNKTGQIIFSNHRLEFLRFFRKHKELCDSISGLKPNMIRVKGEHTPIMIKKKNFKMGIEKLNSFLIDNKHYILERIKQQHLMEQFYQLEEDFINDEVYKNYTNKEKDLSVTNRIDYNKRYLTYLKRTFEISNILNTYLQKTLNIASREVIKSVSYVDYDGFFNNLADYKDEISNDLANISYSNLYEHYKKMLGFYYTYRYLIDKKQQNDINSLFNILFDYLTIDDTIKAIIKLKEGGDFTNSFRTKINSELRLIRNVLNLIYEIINKAFSNKNILPKITEQILVDTTLI